MPVKTYSVAARTTPEKAYAYLSDLRRHPEWSPDNLTVEPQGSGDVDVGTRYRTVGHLQGKPNEAIVEITELAPATRFSFRSADSNGRSTWLHEFTLTPENGGTRIDRKVSVVRAPALLNIIFPLLHPIVIGPGNMKSMEMLKAKLEAGA